MKKIKVLFFAFLLAIITSSCYNDNEEDVYALFGQVCDTINVNYEKNIKTFLNYKCVSCHDGSHPTCNLNNYIQASNYALLPASNLYSTVSNNNHKNCYLNECELKQLKLWIENGAH